MAKTLIDHSKLSSTQSFKKMNQNGRTLGEMLTVLAIMGILSVVTFAGYQISINKSKANDIIQDGRIMHTLSFAKKQETEDWETNAEFIAKSNKTFSFKKDKKDNTYIKVSDVEKEICKYILNFKGDKLGLYTTENTSFTDCQNNNDIVMDFDNNGLMAECEKASDCSGEKAYCSASGQCSNCGYLYQLTETADGCECEEGRTETAEGCGCFSDTELVCSDDENHTWCCGGNTICGTTYPECSGSNGTCSYSIATTDASTLSTTLEADCWYNVSETDTNTISSYLSSDCAYTVTNPASYDTTTYSSLGEVKVATGCSGANEYCALFWTKQTWQTTENPTLGNAASGTIYGKCQPMSSYSELKTATEITSQSALVGTPSQKCSNNNEYCALFWTKQTWSETENPTLGNAASGLIYGKCQPMSSYSELKTTSETSDSSNIGLISRQQGCPAGKYCLILWKNSDCSTASANIENSTTDTGYGTCIGLSENSATCQISED